MRYSEIYTDNELISLLEEKPKKPLTPKQARRRAEKAIKTQGQIRDAQIKCREKIAKLKANL